MKRLQIEVVPPAFRFAIDPRLTNTTWEFHTSTDPSAWDILPISDPAVTCDPVTGEVEVGGTGEPSRFLRLRGTVTE